MMVYFIIVAVMATVALAQPFVNAPLFPMVASVTGNHSPAVVATVVAGGYVLTADATGVRSMNGSAPTTDNAFLDPLLGVTQLWVSMPSSGNPSVVAIAGSVVALYKMNETNVWRAATLAVNNATFDIQTESSPYGPSNVHPGTHSTTTGSAMFVLGTRNTSNFGTTVDLWSSVYALDPNDLSIVWTTTLNSDSTNFATSGCSEFVWVLTQNHTIENSTIVVRKLYMNNGTMALWKMDTGYSSLTYFNVQYSQIMVLNSDGYYDVYWLNGSHIVQRSFSPCGSMPFHPFVINGIWFAICDSSVHMLNNATLSHKSFSATSNFHCVAVRNALNDEDFVMSSRDVVYVGNSSGVFPLLTIPAPATRSSYSYCTGARFDWFPDVGETNVVYLSYIGSAGNAGSVVAMNYRTREIVAQIVGDVAPFGAAVADRDNRRVFVASVVGDVLQGYQCIEDTKSGSPSFLANFSSTMPRTFSIAYNATNRSTYYISSSSLYIIDSNGNVEKLGAMPLYASGIAPVMIRQYLIMFVGGGGAYVFDSVTKTLVHQNFECFPYEQVAPVVSGMLLIVFCKYTYSAQVLDLGPTPPTTRGIRSSSHSIQYIRGAAVIDWTLIVTTEFGMLQGFDIRSAMTTPLWTISSQWTNIFVVSPIVEFKGNGYFIGNDVDYVNFVYVVTPSGLLFQACKLSTFSLEYHLIIKSGGIFGAGVVYVFGTTNVTAFTTSWSKLFTYESTSGAIQTLHQNNPAVLDNGAVCFYTSHGWFNVIGGFDGAFAWRYPSHTNLYYPILTDGSSIFFTDGQYVIGANVLDGTVASISTYLTGNTRGFTIATGGNWTAVIAATDEGIVFANQVGRNRNATATFPGAGSVPDADEPGSGNNTPLIVGCVLGGVLLVLVGLVVVLKWRRDAAQLDEDVPMNPSTQQI